MRGVSHVHTKYSRDSSLEIQDLNKKCSEKNLDFVLIADHFEDMSEKDVDKMIDECERGSDGVEIIPGVEIVTSETHLLLYGLKETPILNNPSEIQPDHIREMKRENPNLTVGIAHFGYPQNNIGFEEIDFIEVWNYRYDGIYPDFKKIKECTKASKKTLLGGVDAHTFQNIDKIVTLTKGDVLEGIKKKKVKTLASIGSMDFRGKISYRNKKKALLHPLIFTIKKIGEIPQRFFSDTKREPPKLLSRIKRKVIG